MSRLTKVIGLGLGVALLGLTQSAAFAQGIGPVSIPSVPAPSIPAPAPPPAPAPGGGASISVGGSATINSTTSGAHVSTGGGSTTVQSSAAELMIAKNLYVQTRSGWFSERSAAYLASGRPVVVQDSGFTEWLPAGDGVLAFRTPQEARDRIREVSGAYQRHCAAARDVAERYFDSRRVLSLLLESALAGGG